jgi:competence protein ComEA
MFRTAAVALLVIACSAPALMHAQSAPAAASPDKTAMVNINTATAAEFEALPGIGSKMAQRIVEYREKNGGFKKLEDLMNVKGIGEKNFLKLKGQLTVAPPKH